MASSDQGSLGGVLDPKIIVKEVLDHETPDRSRAGSSDRASSATKSERIQHKKEEEGNRFHDLNDKERGPGASGGCKPPYKIWPGLEYMRKVATVNVMSEGELTAEEMREATLSHAQASFWQVPNAQAKTRVVDMKQDFGAYMGEAHKRISERRGQGHLDDDSGGDPVQEMIANKFMERYSTAQAETIKRDLDRRRYATRTFNGKVKDYYLNLSFVQLEDVKGHPDHELIDLEQDADTVYQAILWDYFKIEDETDPIKLRHDLERQLVAAAELEVELRGQRIMKENMVLDMSSLLANQGLRGVPVPSDEDHERGNRHTWAITRVRRILNDNSIRLNEPNMLAREQEEDLRARQSEQMRNSDSAIRTARLINVLPPSYGTREFLNTTELKTLTEMKRGLIDHFRGDGTDMPQIIGDTLRACKTLMNDNLLPIMGFHILLTLVAKGGRAWRYIMSRREHLEVTNGDPRRSLEQVWHGIQTWTAKQMNEGKLRTELTLLLLRPPQYASGLCTWIADAIPLIRNFHYATKRGVDAERYITDELRDRVKALLNIWWPSSATLLLRDYEHTQRTQGKGDATDVWDYELVWQQVVAASELRIPHEVRPAFRIEGTLYVEAEYAYQARRGASNQMDARNKGMSGAGGGRERPNPLRAASVKEFSRGDATPGRYSDPRETRSVTSKGKAKWVPNRPKANAGRPRTELSEFPACYLCTSLDHLSFKCPIYPGGKRDKGNFCDYCGGEHMGDCATHGPKAVMAVVEANPGQGETPDHDDYRTYEPAAAAGGEHEGTLPGAFLGAGSRGLAEEDF